MTYEELYDQIHSLKEDTMTEAVDPVSLGCMLVAGAITLTVIGLGIRADVRFHKAFKLYEALNPDKPKFKDLIMKTYRLLDAGHAGAGQFGDFNRGSSISKWDRMNSSRYVDVYSTKDGMEKFACTWETERTFSETITRWHFYPIDKTMTNDEFYYYICHVASGSNGAYEWVDNYYKSHKYDLNKNNTSWNMRESSIEDVYEAAKSGYITDEEAVDLLAYLE